LPDVPEALTSLRTCQPARPAPWGSPVRAVIEAVQKHRPGPCGVLVMRTALRRVAMVQIQCRRPRAASPVGATPTTTTMCPDKHHGQRPPILLLPSQPSHQRSPARTIPHAMVMRKVTVLDQRRSARVIGIRDTVRKAIIQAQVGKIVRKAVDTRGNPARQIE